jgi:hypothetical protein
MRGLIKGRDVVRHFFLVCRHFGPRCAWRCASALVTRRPSTFLNIAFEGFGGGEK